MSTYIHLLVKQPNLFHFLCMWAGEESTLKMLNTLTCLQCVARKCLTSCAPKLNTFELEGLLPLYLFSTAITYLCLLV